VWRSTSSSPSERVIKLIVDSVERTLRELRCHAIEISFTDGRMELRVEHGAPTVDSRDGDDPEPRWLEVFGEPLAMPEAKEGDAPLAALGLGPRVQNALTRAGARTVEQARSCRKRGLASRGLARSQRPSCVTRWTAATNKRQRRRHEHWHRTK
jgi:hypothetical protein